MIRIHNPLEDWQPPTAPDQSRVLREESEAAVEEVARRVRRDASKVPGWDSLADRIGAQQAGGLTYAGLPPDDEEAGRAFDLEYGTDREAPTGFMRSAALRHGPEATRQMTGRILHRMWGGA